MGEKQIPGSISFSVSLSPLSVHIVGYFQALIQAIQKKYTGLVGSVPPGMTESCGTHFDVA